MYTKEQLAKMDEESKPKEDPLVGIPSFTDFTASTTFHGIHYIFDGKFLLRRYTLCFYKYTLQLLFLIVSIAVK